MDLRLLNSIRDPFSVDAGERESPQHVVGGGEVRVGHQGVGDLLGKRRRVVRLRVGLDEEVVGRDRDEHEEDVLVKS